MGTKGRVNLSRRVVSIALGACLAGGGLFLNLRPTAAATQTLTPVADAYVDSKSATKNFGGTSRLKMRGSSSGRLMETYLRFQVSGVGPVTSATLRLFVHEASNAGGSAFALGSSWTESGVRWNNRPAVVGGALHTAGAVAAGTWVEYDVSALVTGDGIYNLAILNGTNDQATFHSREGKQDPQLVLVTGGTSPPTPNPDILHSVSPTAETDPVRDAGDAADDPAIWVNPANPALSVIIGTDKLASGGLGVYDLSGDEIAFHADGAMNNVDLRPGFPLGGSLVSLVTATRRPNSSIAIYRVDTATRSLVNVESRVIPILSAHGTCMYRSPVTGAFFFFGAAESSLVEQWELFDDGSGKVDARLVRSFDVGLAIEGCVADDALGHLYVGEETVGIWRYGAEPTAGGSSTDRVLVDRTGAGGHLTADVEGLTIAYGADGAGYLLASSQGSNSYVAYQRAPPNGYLFRFRVQSGGSVDGVSNTDGIDVTVAPLGTTFPGGVFVAQDGSNGSANQNFKLVRWDAILDAAGLSP